jgi:hypothetical protein
MVADRKSLRAHLKLAIRNLERTDALICKIAVAEAEARGWTPGAKHILSNTERVWHARIQTVQRLRDDLAEDVRSLDAGTELIGPPAEVGSLSGRTT